MNINTIDPLFYTLFAARFDSRTIEASPSLPCMTPYNDALSTNFEIATRSGQISENFDMSSALLNIEAPSSANTISHYVVAQFEGAVVAAIFQKTTTLETMSGEFISSSNIFALDALSEMWAISHLKTAQLKIVERAVEMLSPILSGETGRMLGKRLGMQMTPQTAEMFADPFFENLLKHASPNRKLRQ